MCKFYGSEHTLFIVNLFCVANFHSFYRHFFGIIGVRLVKKCNFRYYGISKRQQGSDAFKQSNVSFYYTGEGNLTWFSIQNFLKGPGRLNTLTFSMSACNPPKFSDKCAT